MRRRAARALATALLLAGCSADPVPPSPPPAAPALLEPVSPQEFTFAAGPVAVAELAVRVRDAAGRPVPDVAVQWEPAQRVEPIVARTDARGEARATWRIGSQATGPLLPEATATIATPQGTRTIGFRARVNPGPVVVATVVRGDTLPRRTGIVVEVGQRARFTTVGRDEFGNPVDGTPATWSTSDAARATVDANGVLTGVRQGAVRVNAAIPTASIVPWGNALIVDPLRAREVAVGEHWSCALGPAGTVDCWGARFTMPFLPVDSVVEPVRVAPMIRFASLRGSTTFACALAADSVQVWCWRGREVQILPTAAPVVPVRALAGEPLAAIAVNDRAVCGLARSGDGVRCASLAVRTDGAGDVAVGAPSAVLTGAPPFRAIAASDSMACAAADDGVHCWTATGTGVTAAARLAGSAPAADVELSETRVCHTDAAGQLRCAARTAAGYDPWTTPLAAPLRRFSAGGFVTCGVTADARLQCAGVNAFGLLQRRDFDPPTTLVETPSPDGSGWSAVAVTDYARPVGSGQPLSTGHACAVTGAGRTYCWGANNRAQLGVPNEHPCGTQPSVPCGPTPLPVPSPRATGARSVVGAP